MEGALRNLEVKVEESKGDAFLRSIKALNKGCMRTMCHVRGYGVHRWGVPKLGAVLVIGGWGRDCVLPKVANLR